METVQFANAMVALPIQINGAIPSLHYRFEVDAFIEYRKMNEGEYEGDHSKPRQNKRREKDENRTKKEVLIC